MHRIQSRLFVLPLLLLALGSALAVACSDEDGENASGVTGRPEFDRLVSMVLDRDASGLAAAVSYIDLACAVEIDGLGGPPQCEPGEADGTVVSVLPAAACEGYYARPESVEELFSSQIREPQLYAAFSLKERGTAEFPLGEYGLLFSVEDPHGMGTLGLMLGVSDDGEIVNFWRGCAATADSIFDSMAGSEILVKPTA